MGWKTPDSNAGFGYSIFPRELYAFAAPQAVSTPTPLLALVELGRDYQDIVVTLRNHTAGSQAAFYVNRSESGAVNDADPQTVIVPALSERRLEFRDVLSLWWGLDASGDPDAAYPSVSVSWQIIARRRR